ncbi:MAG: tetratricopeptide repeat protein [Planctomycetes bacterium]|nr:tetratricopeptide repeat protein [Planctomycetota bacterium]
MDYKSKLKIREFKSLDEFKSWWTSGDVREFCARHPGKLKPLAEHRWVKPWLEQFFISENIQEQPEQNIRSFGKYIIEKKLGEGGMGLVYLARDPDLNRKVALKIMTSKGKDYEERFLREARATAKLKHPNIIQVYEVGTVDKYHYFTMEYIDGTSLEEMIAENNIPQPRRVAEIMAEVVSALEYAHRQGIIHRDIKPGNILLDKSGRPFLTDFGLAKELSGFERSLTISGTVVGTPDYMSPEQATGLKGQVDIRSDIFSMGAMFYHVLTGQAPFTGKELYKILDSIVHKDPLAPSTFVHNLSRDLETICLKCLSKDPKQRYQTAEALKEDLTRFLEGRNILSRPVGPLGKLIRKIKKNKALSAAIGAAIILALVSGMIVFDYRSGENKRTRAKLILDKIRMSKSSLEEALNAVDEALEIDPSFGEVWEVKGLLYVDKRQYEKAFDAYTKALELNPKLVFSYYKRGVISWEIRKKPDEALADFQKIIEIDPEGYMGYLVKGRLEYEQGNHEAALKEFNKAIELKNDPEAYLWRATDYVRLKNMKLALADYQKAAQLGEDRFSVQSSLAYFYYAMGTYDKALEYYNKSLKILPKDPVDLYYRGSVYVELGEAEKALADFNRSIEVEPVCNDIGYVVYLRRAEIYNHKGDLEKALADFNEAIRIFETMPFKSMKELGNAYRARGSQYSENGEYKKAIADLEKAIKFDPENPKSYSYIGAAYASLQDYDKSFYYFNKGIESGKGYDCRLYIGRGYIYGLRQQSNKTLADFEKAIEIAEKYPDQHFFELHMAYTYRGKKYMTEGRFDQAVADFTKAIVIKPGDALLYHNRGYVYLLKQDIDKAIADFTESIKLNPKEPSSYYNRASCYEIASKYEEAIEDGKMYIMYNPDGASDRMMEDKIKLWKEKLTRKKPE